MKNKRFTFSASAATIEKHPLKFAEGSENSRILSGYAVVWGAMSLPGYGDERYTFSPGVIEWTPDVLALYHHMYEFPLASTSNGTLKMSVDDIGWAVEITLPNTTYANDLLENVRSQLIRGMSFGGYMEDWDKPNGDKVINVKKFRADEVTATVAPRFIETTLQVKAEQHSRPTSAQLWAERRKLDQLKLAVCKPGRVSGR